MTTGLTDITLHDIEYIALHMRENDKDEIFGLLPHDSTVRFAWEAYHVILNTGRGKIAWHNGMPAALAAFTENWPGNWQVWMFGTDDFKSAAIPLIRWFRKEANEILSVCEGRRLQADSIASHDEAHKMIQAFGGRPEGPPMKAYGKQGADYQRFVWLNGEDNAVLEKHFKRAS